MMDTPAIATDRKGIKGNSSEVYNRGKSSVLRASDALFCGRLITGIHAVLMTDNAKRPALTPAEENPWYLLATLHGVPDWRDKELQDKNRTDWNRYHASVWSETKREWFKDWIVVEELTPFDEQELTKIRLLFAERAGKRSINIPDLSQEADFSLCHFNDTVHFDGYAFARPKFSDATFSEYASFSRATFSGGFDFSRARFLRGANFSSVIVSGYTNFYTATFSGGANFSRATFSGTAGFSSTIFSGRADFSRATFSIGANFSSTTFSQDTYFSAAIFSGHANFSSNTFTQDANFSRATFSEEANFSGAKFSRDANFSSNTFSGSANFCSAKFSRHAYFSSAKFSGDTSFSSSTFSDQVGFTNAQMKAPTIFEDSRFEQSPPTFHGAKLHEGTVWRGVSWPPPPANRRDAGIFTDAYERLKLEMDRLKKHEDELFFFAKELECRRVKDGWLCGLPIALYGWLSDYGRSYRHPLYWLLCLFITGLPILLLLQPDMHWKTALMLSFVNCLGGFGFRKEFMGSVLDELGTGAVVVSIVQNILGLILVFLIGLGLRNRFRMK